MSQQILQVLRLPFLSLRRVQQSNCKGEEEGKAPPLQQHPGLNMVFPACPTCACKVSPLQTPLRFKLNGGMADADIHEPKRQKWRCQKCHTSASEHSISWTFRVTATVTSPLVSPADVQAELAASILGTAADSLFGCTAARWVECVDLATKMLRDPRLQQPGSRSTLSTTADSIEHMAEQLTAAADIVANVTDEFILADLKSKNITYTRNHGGFANQHKIARISAPAASHNIAGNDAVVCKESLPTLLFLLQYVVTGILAAEVDSTTLLQILDPGFAHVQVNYCIADILEPAPVSLPTLANDPLIAASTLEQGTAKSAAVDDIGRTFAMWPPNRCRCNWRVLPLETEPSKEAAPCLSAPGDIRSSSSCTSISDGLSVDGLFDHCSQLFVDEASRTRPKADTPALSSQDPILSAHLLEESCRDEYMHRLYVDSQEELARLSMTPLPTSQSQNSVFNSGLLDDLNVSALLAAVPPTNNALGSQSESVLFSPSAISLSGFELTPETATVVDRCRRYEHQLSHILQLRPTTPVSQVDRTHQESQAALMGDSSRRNSTHPHRPSPLHIPPVESPLVLAEDTPVASGQHSPLSPEWKYQVVCETPAAKRNLSFNVPSPLHRSAIVVTPSRTNNTSPSAYQMLVPETPVPNPEDTSRVIRHRRRSHRQSPLIESRINGAPSVSIHGRSGTALSAFGTKLGRSMTAGNVATSTGGYTLPPPLPLPRHRPQRASQRARAPVPETPASRTRPLTFVKSNSTSSNTSKKSK